MGTPTERQQTTDYAIKRIDENRSPERYTVALLLSFIYVNIRLRSLLTDHISPTKRKWKETHKILGSLRFPQLLKYCKEFGLISDDEREKLQDLENKRNQVAHESVMWKSLTTQDLTSMERHCRFAKDFLGDHSNTPRGLLDNSEIS